MRTWSLLLFVALCGSSWAHHHFQQHHYHQQHQYQSGGQHGHAVPDHYLKQQEIQTLVDLINKPVRPDYQEASNVIQESELRNLGRLSRHEVFSLFDERNIKEVISVIRILYEAPTFEQFLARARVVIQRVNEDLFLYGLSVALTLRPDTTGVHVPRVHDIYPDKFLPRDLILKVKEITQNGHYRDQVPIVDATEHGENQADPNHQLAYYLEDVAMNSHHHYWHVLHPAVRGKELGGSPDRQGEIFFWTHKQMVAKYDSELLSNELPRVAPFENWNEPIQVGYAPNLVIDKTGYRYAYRPQGSALKDLPNLPRNKMIEWRNRLVTSIHLGYLLAANGSKISLNSDRAINYIAEAVEANRESLNHPFYGNLHNYAHVIAGKVTTPAGVRGERSGVMYDVTTSARDPLFYSWHKYIDAIMQEHKELRSYSREERSWNDVEVNSVHVHVPNVSSSDVVRTYYQHSLYPIGAGFTFTPNSPALVKLRHLNHESYYYKIGVTNKAGAQKQTVVRIFGAVTEDERGHNLELNSQRHLVLELDKFVATLTPGQNTIIRHSNQSSVTSSVESFYAPLDRLKPEAACQCGWPNYLLLPKGKRSGLKFRIYVVLTDWQQDQVKGEHYDLCHNNINYCGSPWQKYPDRRPLGYPFDRHIEERDFQSFKTPNMGATDIKIYFTGRYLAPNTDYLSWH